MGRFATFGNDLHSGKRSIDFIGKRKLWYIISIVGILISIFGPILRGGFEFGIQFRGGSQFVVVDAGNTDQAIAIDAVTAVVPDAIPRVSTVGGTSIRVQIDEVSDEVAREVSTSLATAYDVSGEDVDYSFVGATWGADVTNSMVQALVIFLIMAALIMTIYFRNWKVAATALIALLHDLIITTGIYGLAGFEITPAAVIGFLMILGYSLYDTVVVFDSVRENTRGWNDQSAKTFGELVNLSVNQTLVRSINTSVVALLPIASILFIGAFLMGAGTLRDISLALFIGIFIGTYSTIFVASPIYAQLREAEKKVKKINAAILRRREAATQDAPLSV